MRSKKLTAGLAATAALALPFVFAAPAAAATLPAGDALYAITCDYDYELEEGFAVLYSVDPADAHGTMVANTTTGITDDCAGQAAFNPVTELSYYVSWTGSDQSLARIDVSTGLATVIGEFSTGYADSMAIGKDGTAYAIWSTGLYRLNLTDATMTYVGELGSSGFYAFAVDPVSGEFYAVHYDGDAYRINTTTGAAEFIGTIVTDGPPGYYIYSLQIDTSGAWWIERDVPSASEIYTGPRPEALDTEFALVGLFDDIVNEYTPYTESLLLTYPKALAATGLDATVLVGAGVTAGLLLLMGAAVIVLRRRTSD